VVHLADQRTQFVGHAYGCLRLMMSWAISLASRHYQPLHLALFSICAEL
jgi:hypothetical protein